MKIAPGIHFLAVDDEGVALNLQTNRYLAYSRISTIIWLGLAAGDSRDTVASKLSKTCGLDAVDASHLVARQLQIWESDGLATFRSDTVRRPDLCDLPHPRTVERPVRALESAELANARWSLTSLALLLRSNRWCRVTLKTRGLASALRDLQELHCLRIPAGGEQDALRRTVRVYRAMRSLFAQGDHDCLGRSLTLCGALRRQGIDAVVSFGVTKLPFAAHAWVQYDDVLLNDALARVSPFAVIAQF